jgi:hypothetical protein
MATRENQNLQIVIITLCILVLILGVLAGWMYSSKNTAQERAGAAETAKQSADRAAREAQAEANSYKTWMGFDESQAQAALDELFKADMQRFGSTFEEASRQYRTILENIFEENRKLAQSEAAAKERERDLKERLLATEQQKNQQIAQYESDKKQLAQDLASERSKFQQQYGDINKEKDQIAAQLAELRQRIDDLTASFSTQLKEKEQTIAKLDRVITILESNQATPDPYLQPADGLVRWVDQREGKVWINLGEADEIRTQVTFSVYSGDTNDVETAQSKGTIEVTRILSDSMAEARITSDIATRPLMEGDKIYSQVWNPGRQVGFAVTGFVDIDKDGREDLEELRSIVELNGGKIDAQPDPNGTVNGEMTADTRYLILGEFPDDSTDRSDSLRKAWVAMNEEANTLNVEVITLDEFLSLMGWKAENRAVKLGAGARAENFPAHKIDYTTPMNLNSNKDKFRRRTPAASY